MRHALLFQRGQHYWAVVLLTFILAACRPAAPTIDYTQPVDLTPVYGDRLTSSNNADPTTLIPWLATDSASGAVNGYLYEALLQYNEALELEGALAERWQISADKRTITFTLRRGLKWADGTPLTSADVLATWQAITAPTTITPYAADYLLVKTARAPTPYTFTVTYAEPFAPALASWAGLAILPRHRLAETTDLRQSSLNTQPLGSGPYALAQWQRGSHVDLVANPHYYRGQPYLTGQRLRLISDPDAAFMELRAGRLDSLSLKPGQYRRVQTQPALQSRFNTYRYLSRGYTYLGFNLKFPLFQDVRVRQALSYATPREAIIKGVLHGQGEPTVGPFQPGSWAAHPTLQPYPYNPTQARALLAAAGWLDTDGDGWLDRAGERFRFTVVTNQNNPQRLQVAEIMQAAFKQVGIQMEIVAQEWSTFVENTINGRNFQAVILGWTVPTEPDPYDIFHSSRTGPREFNFISYNNPEADQLMVTSRRTFNPTQRAAALHRFQEILHHDQPYLFLYTPYALVALHKRVQGVVATPTGISYNAANRWYVPAAWQHDKMMVE